MDNTPRKQVLTTAYLGCAAAAGYAAPKAAWAFRSTRSLLAPTLTYPQENR